MRLRSPTPISLLRAGPPSRRDLASDTRTPHFRSSSTSCCSPFSTLLLRFQSTFHVPLFLPQPPAFRRSYTFARRSIPGPIIVLVSFYRRPTCVPRPGLISSPGAARSLHSSDSQAVTREDHQLHQPDSESPLSVSLSGPMQARNSPVTSMSSTQTQVAAAAGTTYDNLSKQLQEWTQTSITNLYNLDQDPQTQSLFVPDAQITVNGDKLSPEKYDEQIKEVRAGATQINTVWGDIVSVPEDKSVRYRLSSVTDAPLTCAWNSALSCSKDLTPLPALQSSEYSVARCRH